MQSLLDSLKRFSSSQTLEEAEKVQGDETKGLKPAMRERLRGVLERKLKMHQAKVSELRDEGKAKEDAMLQERRSWNSFALAPLAALVSQMITLHAGRVHKRVQVEEEQCAMVERALGSLDSLQARPSPAKPPRATTTTDSETAMAGASSGNSPAGTRSHASPPSKPGLRFGVTGNLVKVYLEKETFRRLKRKLQHIRGMKADFDALAIRYAEMQRRLVPIEPIDVRKRQLRSLLTAKPSPESLFHPSNGYQYHPENITRTDYIRRLLMDSRKPEGQCVRTWVDSISSADGATLRSRGGLGQWIAGFYSELTGELIKRYELADTGERGFSSLRLDVERLLHTTVADRVEEVVPMSQYRANALFVREASAMARNELTTSEILPRLIRPLDAAGVGPRMKSKYADRVDSYDESVTVLKRIAKQRVPAEMIHTVLSTLQSISDCARRNLALGRCAWFERTLEVVVELTPLGQAAGGQSKPPSSLVAEYLGGVSVANAAKGKGAARAAAVDGDLNADELFPLVVWVVARACVPNMVSQLYIAREASARDYTDRGQTGLCLSLAEAAVEHVLGDAKATIESRRGSVASRDAGESAGNSEGEVESGSDNGSGGVKISSDEPGAGQDEQKKQLALEQGAAPASSSFVSQTNENLCEEKAGDSNTAQANESNACTSGSSVPVLSPSVPSPSGDAESDSVPYESKVISQIPSDKAVGSRPPDTGKVEQEEPDCGHRRVASRIRIGATPSETNEIRSREDRRQLLHSQLLAFYKIHAPHKVSGVMDLVNYYADDPQKLNLRLKDTYGAGIL